MAQVFIVKKGIKNVVSEELFKRVYKKQGWAIDTDRQPSVKGVEHTLKTETEFKNYKEMKRKTDKVFNDDLIKKGE